MHKGGPVQPGTVIVLADFDDVSAAGGITFDTVGECARAGADVFVSGTGIFGQHSLKAAVKKMRAIALKSDPGLADLQCG